jgi:hypothetical protein
MTNKYSSGDGLEMGFATLGNSSDFNFPAIWLKYAFAIVRTVTCPSNREGSGQPRGAPGCPVLLLGGVLRPRDTFLIFDKRPLDCILCRNITTLAIRAGFEDAETGQFNILLTEQNW